MTATAAPKVQRQIALPLSKAVEIAWKSIRLRLSRSLVVTSGIVLALAFLMSIRATEAFVTGMRGWIDTADNGFAELKQQRTELEAKNKPIEQQLRAASKSTGSPDAFDDRAVLGQTLPELQKELGTLPLSADDLSKALAADPKLVEPFKQWIATERQLNDVKNQITGPQQLESLMKAKGVPTTPQEISNDRIQTRWLLGLALLVAFVGILNAMLMSVTERFREIGTMKCLGALDGFIIKLFLIESLFQGGVGTIAGVILGLLASFASVAGAYGHFAWANFPAAQIAIDVVFCTLVGVLLTVAAAVYPAWQAARMQPIDAMRVET
jgi:putative ABC transport system permease protein